MLTFRITSHGQKDNLGRDYLGSLPSMLSAHDPRTAREQLDAAYGWRPFKGFSMEPDGTLTYPNDPDMHPLATAKLHGETIHLYLFSWVSIVQPDGSFEVMRMD